MSNNLQTALSYLNRGFSVVPLLDGTKRPMVKWEEYQKRRMTDKEARKIWTENPDKGIFIICGGISGGLRVIDEDGPEAAAYVKGRGGLEACPRVRTGNGNIHYYCRAANGQHVPNMDFRNSPLSIPLEVRGEGQGVVAPPSLHPKTGKPYKWELGLGEADLSLVPAWFLKDFNSPLPHTLSPNTTNTTPLILNCNANANLQIGLACPQLSTTVHNCPQLGLDEGSRDQSIYHVAVCLKRGGMDLDNATKVIEIIAKSCNPPFPMKDATEKIKSAFEHGIPSERMLASEIREWVLSTTGHFLSTDVHKEFNLSTRVHKKNVSEIMRRMVMDGAIERVSGKNACFRKVERTCEEMEWWNADSKNTFDVEWPFSLEKLVRLYPKNIVVLAGAINAGKTAFLLNTAWKNIPKYSGRIHYFNSETGEDELHGRLEDFGFPIDEWLNIKFWYRSSDFADAIYPDDINIIDYMEVLDNFYLVGKMIKDVFDKLRNGIAIIALQKKDGSDLGRGAEFGLEKPRLYLSMGSGKLKIMKAKNWTTKNCNPNGREFAFKLGGGCRFVDVSSNELTEMEF